MKKNIILLIAAVLLLVGCEYDSPLTEEQSIPIDSAVIGLWEMVTDEEVKPGPDDRLMILKYSDTEYLIHYPMGEYGIYYRGYPIKVGNVSCVQIQVVGTRAGPVGSDEKEIFHIVSYQLANGVLEIKTLNTDLVDNDLQGSEALRKAFLKHKDNKNLFTNPGRFVRVKR